MSLRVISLFSGIGGLDLGFERAGFQIVAQVEIDDFCRRVLRKHWPDVPQFEDIRHVGKHNLPGADVIMGGFPCQDISIAGKRQGIKEGTRSGLWLEFARIIGELRPRIVLLENVPAITTLDGTTVIADLAALGYDAEWGIVAASDAGAPHRRERWFCVAYPGLSRRDKGVGVGSSAAQVGEVADGRFALGYANVAVSRRIRRRQRGNYRGWGLVSHHQHRNAAQSKPEGNRWQCRSGAPSQTGDVDDSRCASPAQRTGIGGDDGTELATTERADRNRTETDRSLEPGMGRIFDGLPGWLDGIRRDSRWPARPGEAQAEWEAPRTVTGKVKDRANRIKSLGNAVVPQVAYAMALVVRASLEKVEAS